MNRTIFSILTLGFVLLLSQFSWAAGPVLNFSDITSGPKTGLGDGLGSGAIVTIWGNNLGSSQGSSHVYVGSVEAAYVYEWGNATQHAGHPADLYTYNKMQAVMFSVPASAVNGANTIKVTVNGVDSNTLPFTVRTGNIYHVKTTGNDSTGNGSWSSPWRKLNAYSDTGCLTNSKMTAGSIVYVGDGISEPSISARDLVGTASNPIAIIAYPGASAIATNSGIDFYGATCAYVHVSKMTAATDSDGIGMNIYGRVIGNEITNKSGGCADGQGGAITGSNLNVATVNGNIVLGNYIHDFGGVCTTGFHHTFYISNRSGSAVNAFELGWNYINNSHARGGLHIYDEGACGDYTGSINVHDNVVKDQAASGIGISGGLGQSNCITAPINIWNNLLINVGIDPDSKGWSGSAVDVNKSGLSSNIKFYNNTIYGYGTSSADYALAIQGSGSGDWVFAGSFEWVNNIVVDTHNGPYEWPTYSKTPAVHSNNIWYSTITGHAGPPSWDTNPITLNPVFINSALGDFHINFSSPAKNAGTNSLGILISKDIVGTPRKTTPSAPCIGAFEYDSGTPYPSPPVLH